jgi:hypothetical protein
LNLAKEKIVDSFLKFDVGNQNEDELHTNFIKEILMNEVESVRGFIHEKTAEDDEDELYQDFITDDYDDGHS